MKWHLDAAVVTRLNENTSFVILLNSDYNLYIIIDK